MIYYRTHASRKGCLPTELAGWDSVSVNGGLVDNTVGDHRIVGIVPPFVFNPPSVWHDCEHGWEVGVYGTTDLMCHVLKSSPFSVLPIDIGGVKMLFPAILNPDGSRAFKVMYGGVDFKPILSAMQSRMLELANEARNAHDVDMPIKARWAAEILSAVYAISVRTFSVIGLSEDVIDTTISVAGGRYAGTES